MTNYIKNRKNIILITLTIISILLVGFWISLKFQKPTLTIIATPTDAYISVNGQAIGQGKISKKLPPGNYSIDVTKDVYVPSHQTIVFTKTLTLPINLVKKTVTNAIPEKINESLYTASKYRLITVVNDDQFIAIDRDTDRLISFHISANSQETVFSQSVESYSLAYPWISIKTSSPDSKYVLLNLQNQSLQEINLNQIQPSSLPAVSSLGQLAVLGKISVTRHTANLYLINPSQNTTPEILSITEANQIAWQGNNYLCLFTSQDADKSGFVDIVDIKNKKSIGRISKINNFVISVDGSQVAALTDNALAIIKTDNSQPLTIPGHSRGQLAWIDNQTILKISSSTTESTATVINLGQPNSSYSWTIKANSTSLIIQNIVHASPYYLFAFDKSGSLWRLRLEQ